MNRYGGDRIDGDSAQFGYLDLTVSYVALALADNGEGIPEEMQSKIFDPFFTSKPVGKRTGLGLTVSYQMIVEAHQGLIDVTSVPGEGSAFRIRLPLGKKYLRSVQFLTAQMNKWELSSYEYCRRTPTRYG